MVGRIETVFRTDPISRLLRILYAREWKAVKFKIMNQWQSAKRNVIFVNEIDWFRVHDRSDCFWLVVLSDLLKIQKKNFQRQSRSFYQSYYHLFSQNDVAFSNLWFSRFNWSRHQCSIRSQRLFFIIFWASNYQNKNRFTSLARSTD